MRRNIEERKKGNGKKERGRMKRREREKEGPRRKR